LKKKFSLETNCKISQTNSSKLNLQTYFGLYLF